MRKGNLCFVLLFLVLFYWPNPALSDTVLFPPDSISNIPDLVLEQRGDKADVFFPDVPAISKRFPVVAVLQGAGVDKSFYTGFGKRLARYGFVVVIPNHFQEVEIDPPGPAPPVLVNVIFPDQDVILDVLAQMEMEDQDPQSQLFGIVDTTRMGLVGHSAGGAAGLFAINGSCFPPFCIPTPPFFNFSLPEAVRAGAFYGTNTCGAGGELNDPRCIDSGGFPPNPTGMIFGINNENIPVALVQGSNDGIGTPDEANATLSVLAGPSELFSIDGANHYGITNVNNPGGAAPDLSDPDPANDQEYYVQQVANATGQFLRNHLGIELSVSSQADRSGTTTLEDATLSGNAFIFLTPLFPGGDIEQVDFFLDGLFVKTESWAPYDLKGTYSGGKPAPFNTRTLKDGSHTIRAEIVFPSGVQSVTSTFETLNYESKPSAFRLSVSFSADRSGPIPLEGATLSGDAFIFLIPLFPDGDIDEVDFFLDGLFVKTESWAPYDLKGTRDGGIPAPFDTRRLGNGPHIVRAEIEFSAGEVERVASTFSVSNASGGDDDDD